MNDRQRLAHVGLIEEILGLPDGVFVVSVSHNLNDWRRSFSMALSRMGVEFTHPRRGEYLIGGVTVITASGSSYRRVIGRSNIVGVWGDGPLAAAARLRMVGAKPAPLVVEQPKYPVRSPRCDRCGCGTLVHLSLPGDVPRCGNCR